MTGKDLSIKDIAELAGVSTATVSRILNQNGRYSEETKRRVMQIVEKYGYVLNNSARALRSSSSRTIGLIIPSIRNSFFANIAYYCEDFFYQHNYSVFICDTMNNPQRELGHFRKLISQNVDGIITVSCLNVIPDDIADKNIPIVLVDRIPASNLEIPSVMNNDEKIIFDTTSLLIRKGCKNLVYVKSDTAEYDRTNRTNGFKEALMNAGLPVMQDRILDGNLNDPSLVRGEVLVSEALKKMPIDGIVCSNDRLGVGAIYAVKRAGLRIPEDIRIIAYDNNLESRIVLPALSTVERHIDQISSNACEMLMKLMDGEALEKTAIKINGDIIERESSQ